MTFNAGHGEVAVFQRKFGLAVIVSGIFPSLCRMTCIAFFAILTFMTVVLFMTFDTGDFFCFFIRRRRNNRFGMAGCAVDFEMSVLQWETRFIVIEKNMEPNGPLFFIVTGQGGGNL